MKKFFVILAIFASLQVFDAQAQVKNPSAIKSAVEKAEAATLNAKQNTKAATWIKYGQALMEAYNQPAGNLWVGMSRQELQVVAASERFTSEATVEIGGRAMTKLTYANKNLYFNERGQLEIIEITAPVVENALDKAFAAYAKAGEVDAKGQKSKDIKAALEDIAAKYSSDAYNAYTLSNPGKASILFEQASKAVACPPLSQVDTNAVYNVGFTAWLAGQNDRAKTYLKKVLDMGYGGNDGDVYAKLADIAEKEGDKAASKKYLEDGFTAYPQSQNILVGLINYYMSSGEDTNRLFSLLEGAKKNEPNNASLYYVEGNINLKLGNEDAAIAAYRKCIEINPNYEYGFIGEGILLYNKAVALQNEASNETDDAKYTALSAEFEKTLKACVEPFEKAFELSKDTEIKASVAEYLKNACFRFRTSSPEYQAKYEKYSAFFEAN